MEFYSATKKNEFFSFASKWMELVGLRRPKAASSLSFEDYRSKINGSWVTLKGGSAWEG
jgi:hypothetical protein